MAASLQNLRKTQKCTDMACYGQTENPEVCH
jgi:hypothetical protein